MNFQYIKSVENAKKIMDLAFSKAAKKEMAKNKRISKLDFMKNKESAKVDAATSFLADKFGQIIEEFPSINKLPVFYKELLENNLDSEKLVKALSSISWGKTKIRELGSNARRSIVKSSDEEYLLKHKSAFFGRISSIIKRLDKHLVFLEDSRKKMKEFPDVDENLPAICLAGFPNVGKSTLLSKITNSKPEIKNYAFTTKKLNTGTLFAGLKKIQVIDTPGTLARFDKMNKIEKMAYLAIKYVGDLVVFVFVPNLDYSYEEQDKLYKKIKEFDKDIIIYLSKTDIVDKKVVDDLIKKLERKKVFITTSDKELMKEVKNYFKKK